MTLRGVNTLDCGLESEALSRPKKQALAYDWLPGRRQGPKERFEGNAPETIDDVTGGIAT